MGLEVVLYDPRGEVGPLLEDVFSVTGHTLLSAESPEEFLKLAEGSAQLAVLPSEEVSLWLKALEKKPLLPLFLVEEEKEEELLGALGFWENSKVRIPFNPLELLNKLTLLKKLPPEEVEELDFAPALVKANAQKKELTFQLSQEESVCLVKSYPLKASCERERLRKLLSSRPKLSLSSEEPKGGKTYPGLKDFFEELLEERKAPAVKRETEGVEEIEEGLLVLWREQEKGVLRKNLYLLTVPYGDGHYALLINAGDLQFYHLVDRALKERGLSFKDLHLVLLTEFEPQSVETLKRLSLANPRLGLIARSKTEKVLRSSGLSGVKFRSVEEIPFLKAGLPSGHALKFVPLSGCEPSLALFLERDGLLFTGKLLGNFNGGEELRPLFHRVFFPCNAVLKKNLKLLKDLQEGLRVLPYYGLPYEFSKEVVAELLETDAGLDYELADEELLLSAVSKVFSLLEEEEREALRALLEPLAEMGETGVSALYTSPPVFLERLLGALPSAVKEKERFFEVLKELSRYPFYLPPPEA